MKLFSTRIDFFLILVFIHSSVSLCGQSTSNKGTDFWVGYMAHVDGSSSSMSLYITSDISTSGTVSIPLQGWSTPFTVTANTTTIIAIPAATAYVSCSDCIQDKGIHVTSGLPIVVYSHIYSFQRSDATLVLPVPTLGKDYYAMAFAQTSGGYSEFLVAAVEDSTQIEITPTQTTLGGQVANVPFTVTLNQGQVYQVQSFIDLTGSHITTYNSGNSSCKRVAVFSGSTWCGLGCSNASSRDNLYEQLYPVNAWGNNFVTTPFKTRVGGDYFRILAGSDNTLVIVNGVTPFVLNKTQFLDTLLAVAGYITASKPIMLAQYSRTQNCDNIIGDPAMVILLPVEQTLNKITLYSSPFQDITGEYINVIMKTADVSSFRLDGNTVIFSTVPSNSLYSYSQNTVSSGNHTLIADSGFNAIAYGFGDLESYAYCAGANVRNLNQYIMASSGSIGNPQTLCNGATVNFSGVVSYTPASVKWNFGDGDTSSSLSTAHTYNTPGTYNISLVTIAGTGSSCDTKDSSTYVLTITTCLDVNVAYSNVLCNGGCTGTATANPINGTNPYTYIWSNGQTAQMITGLCAGTYDVTVTDAVSHTAAASITITQPPPVNAGTITALRDTICEGTPGSLMVTGSSGSVQWQSSGTTGNFTNITGATDASYIISVSQTTYLRVYATNGNCADTSALFKLIVKPSPIASFTSSGNGLKISFNSDSSKGATIFNWDFGDGGTSTQPNPVHTYTSAGTYHVCLTVFNGSNCSFTICPNIDVVTGIAGIDKESKFIIYPNPFNDNIFIDGRKMNKDIESVEVYISIGKNFVQ